MRPDLLASDCGRLSTVERFHIGFVRKTLEPGWWDRCLRFCQRHLGARWINLVTHQLLHVHGRDRLPVLDEQQSYILVANHRSFFDLYVLTAHLVGTGLKHRIVFPVRSKFFYDRRLGFLVNGIMSFFAMYPPIFRDRKKAVLNTTSLEELAWLLGRGGTLAGIHPEGTRGLGDDPYSLLPAQRGVGRLIHQAKVPVIPVFIYGLTNSIPSQVLANLNPKANPITVVFGAPVDFQEEFELPSSPKVDRAIAERALGAVAELGQEAKRLREALLLAARAKD